ncbi:MAG: 23S rRNA (pseudouridine(1915)-N(3))-methyltransferase RlmH [Eubacterium sp.]|jgi:23S rRNA (pseudouridine1915-N3)-methyltransferase|nr:23S rRNA (pseudouridine(1915)-N(3))-methyltransferase RlmH [Eubacterium sp.]
MTKINIITMGGLKESYFKECEAEYIKRLKPYCDIIYTELSPIKLPDGPSEKLINAALSKETEEILSRLGSRHYLIALCVEGRQMTSERFAEIMAHISETGKEACFVIGSSFGLSEKIKSAAGLKLSLSAMTLPHQMARVALAEQIYRAVTIQRGMKYHK